ncbi:DNA adenine methylase [Marinobacter nauticus]
MRYYSPLRYPGGKSSLADFMKAVFVSNDILDGVYVEPYAGGSAVALELLMTDYVREIWLNDLDPFIYRFWHSVLNETEEMIDRIFSVDLDVNEWEKQRAILQDPSNFSDVDIGFATLYLNRTNRSGIICGGSVIGGKDQSGKWGIDARFNRQGLADRLRRIGRYSENIVLTNLDAEDFLATTERPDDSLVYLDPPYFHKGQRLYRNSYQPNDHARIADFVQNQIDGHWIVSYDDTPEIHRLYTERRALQYSLRYSAQTKRKGGEFIVFSDELIIPETQNPALFKMKNQPDLFFGSAIA